MWPKKEVTHCRWFWREKKRSTSLEKRQSVGSPGKARKRASWRAFRRNTAQGDPHWTSNLQNHKMANLCCGNLLGGNKGKLIPRAYLAFWQENGLVRRADSRIQLLTWNHSSVTCQLCQLKPITNLPTPWFFSAVKWSHYNSTYLQRLLNDWANSREALNISFYTWYALNTFFNFF